MPVPVKANRLSAEKSPYLRQHQDNPVNWYAWSEEAFTAAKKENKPIFLSIGYSTCYWCHVMEKDSFERTEVAAVLNDNFIAIKVDREEHPDVDAIYMEAVTALTGRGGWPMSVFLTPDLKPFFGGTYFPRAQFMNLLERVANEWQRDPANIKAFAVKLTTAITAEAPAGVGGFPDAKIYTTALARLKAQFDPVYGGFGEAPKFPHPGDIRVLLRIHRRIGGDTAVDPATSGNALTMAVKSLDEMARGGIYDHLGGGFARYATDERWFAPHFEKMLYDNAQLVLAYLEAFQMTGEARYAAVARETLDYVLRAMTSPEGGFYAAQDAGEVGKEGEYYVWTHTALKSALTVAELSAVEKHFHATAAGNWEHGNNILYLSDPDNVTVKTQTHLATAVTKLFAQRTRRAPPHLDNKILTSWNALMITAFAKGHQVLGDDKYLTAATRSADFILKRLTRQGRLLRRYIDGEARLNATLDDHAYFIDALLTLYQSDFDARWVREAASWQAAQDALFWDAGGKSYFYTPSDAAHLIARKKPAHDGALPSANAVALLNLARLAVLTYNDDWTRQSGELAGWLGSRATAEQTAGHAYYLMALDAVLGGAKTVVVAGRLDEPFVKAVRAAFAKRFIPDAVLAINTGSYDAPAEGSGPASANLTLLNGKGRVNGEPAAYVCRDKTCLKPMTEVEEVLRAVE